MKPLIDQTHDRNTRSWVDSANDSGTDFPIQNLPWGVFRRGGKEPPTVGIAIGDCVLDVGGCERAGIFSGKAAEAAKACLGGRLNAFMALGPAHWRALRHSLHALLRANSSEAETHRATLEKNIARQKDIQLLVPALIGDYTDFYASIFHATNVGKLFRPDNPLLPNYKYVPIGYHGRASSIVVSNTPVRRPAGQTRGNPAEPPIFGACRQLDYEAEVGFYVGQGNALGDPIPVDKAEGHIFGLCLLNDWSARDIQAWEYQPLGPFLAKNFATTISPWVVTLDALAPFHAPAYQRPEGDPAPLPYLFDQQDQESGAIDLKLDMFLLSQQMKRAGREPLCLSHGNFRDLYWTMAQMLTHHASSGCNLQPGDLMGSGTASGGGKESRGCLLELTKRGTEPIQLPTGEERRFIEDGDEIILRGYCEREGYARIGLGECAGKVSGR